MFTAPLAKSFSHLSSFLDANLDTDPYFCLFFRRGCNLYLRIRARVDPFSLRKKNAESSRCKIATVAKMTIFALRGRDSRRARKKVQICNERREAKTLAAAGRCVRADFCTDASLPRFSAVRKFALIAKTSHPNLHSPLFSPSRSVLAPK